MVVSDMGTSNGGRSRPLRKPGRRTYQPECARIVPARGRWQGAVPAVRPRVAGRRRPLENVRGREQAMGGTSGARRPFAPFVTSSSDRLFCRQGAEPVRLDRSEVQKTERLDQDGRLGGPEPAIQGLPSATALDRPGEAPGDCLQKDRYVFPDPPCDGTRSACPSTRPTAAW